MKLSCAVKILSDSGVENPRHDARAIFAELSPFGMADMIGCDVEYESEQLRFAVERRASREPLQYVLGFADFYKERYKVSKSCLIPRQETEILVDYAVKNIPEGENFLDLCTGSGCVGISTLKSTVNTTATLVDISHDALAVAKENATLIGVYDRVSFEQLDVTEKIPSGKQYAILANPPYVKDSVYEGLEKEIFHEPKIAFVGGEDGLVFYKKLIPLCKGKLKPCGFIAFEIGYDQGDALKEISAEYGFDCTVIKDLSGLDRVAVLREG